MIDIRLFVVVIIVIVVGYMIHTAVVVTNGWLLLTVGL